MLERLGPQGREVTALCVLLGIWILGAIVLAIYAQTWLDEATYIIKSLHYVTGQVAPYSDEDPTWYMPLFFYELGTWQWLISGGGLDPLFGARLFSIILATLQGIVVYDIIKRLGGGHTSALAGTAILLFNPATAFYFSTAVPAAATALVHTSMLWVLAAHKSIGLNRAAIALGLLCVAVYFHRPNLLPSSALSILALAVLTHPKSAHTLLLTLGAIGAAALGILSVFPDRLIAYALNIPVLSDVLEATGLYTSPLAPIMTQTNGNHVPALSWDSFYLQDVLEAFLLPYAGLLTGLVVGIFFWRRNPALAALTLTFAVLAIIHYVGSAHYCRTCILPYTPYFAAVAAIACAGMLHDAGQGRSHLIALGAFAVVAMNTGATWLAERPGLLGYPKSMLTLEGPTDIQEIDRLSEVFKEAIPARSRVFIFSEIYPVHLAAARAGLIIPPQSLNLRYSQRHIIDPPLSPATERLLISHGYWTDPVLARWIAEDADWLILHGPPKWAGPEARDLIENQFEPIRSTSVRLKNLVVLRRKSIFE